MKRMTRMQTLMILILPALLAISSGCDDEPTDAVVPEHADLVIDLRGIQSLGAGFAYEGWLIVDGEPVSTGTFQVVNGVLQPDAFVADETQLAAATIFVITIEPVPDPDPAPSATRYLAGYFDDVTASMSVGHPEALGDDFTDAAGTYILNTPTTAADVDDYASGIWWLLPGPAPRGSLDLPVLPQGWVYEGWVQRDGDFVSTGRFTMPDGADSDGAGPAAAVDPAPPFPGQDFIDPRRQLVDGYAAVVTVEPEPDDSPRPFTLRPLVDLAIDDVGAGVPQSMVNQVRVTFPTGTVNALPEGVLDHRNAAASYARARSNRR
ncbi:MAG: anti-sigma factor [Candidatus Eiseniibacteriota bacterium]|jgi:hypothetical protein